MAKQGRRLAASVGMMLFLAFLGFPVSPMAAEEGGRDLTRKAERGEAIFQENCSPCHSIGGGDRPTGPDLAGVIEKRDRRWLEQMILNPDQLIDGGDPIVTEQLAKFNNLRMPELGLSQEEADAILIYLAMPSETEHHAPEEAAKAAMVPAGDPQRGKDLFVGTVKFANGGAPCLACHGIAGAGLGPGGAASYGPDLTTLYENFGAEGVASLLEDLPFPSMEPIYAERPLTEQEQVDLAAFFEFSPGGLSPAVRGSFGLAGFVVAAGFLVLAALAGRGRLRKVRRPLVEKNANPSKGEAP